MALTTPKTLTSPKTSKTPTLIRRLALVLACAPILAACDSPPPPAAPPASTAPPATAAAPAPAPSSATAPAVAPAGAARLGQPPARPVASDAEFREALDRHFATWGHLCLPSQQWPFDLSAMEIKVEESRGTGAARQGAALEALGLVQIEDVNSGAPPVRPGLRPPQGPTKRFSLTDAARPYTLDVRWQLETGPRETTEICWGRRVTDRVAQNFGASDESGELRVEVAYTQAVKDIAPWAADPRVLAAFPDIQKTLDAAGKQTERTALRFKDGRWEVIPPKMSNGSFEILRPIGG